MNATRYETVPRRAVARNACFPVVWRAEVRIWARVADESCRERGRVSDAQEAGRGQGGLPREGGAREATYDTALKSGDEVERRSTVWG